MAEVQAFAGVRYRLDRPEDAGALTCPPYDVISPTQREELVRRHPHNMVRLELPEAADGEDRYQHAAHLYRTWLVEGFLGMEPQPALYVYGQRYRLGERLQERLGLLAALKIEPFEAGVVLPHEQTFPKHKEDRYRLLTAASAQFSPIFGLYSSPGTGVRSHLDAVAAGEPGAVSTDPEGVEHRLWSVTDREFIGWAKNALAGQQVFIADGHHRYETALRYRNERRAAHPDASPSPFDSVMTFLVEMDDPGLVLLPTHRLIRSGLPAREEIRRRLEPYFTIEAVPVDEAGELRHHQIGVILPGGEAWRLTLRGADALVKLEPDRSPGWRDLDVAILHRLVLAEALGVTGTDEIVYTRDPAEAREQAVSGAVQAAFMLPPPHVEELKAVAGAGERMPEKSTYFWPKAISGLVIYPE